MNKKILLTGGAGYIGSHVSNLLLEEGYDVTIIDNLITGHKQLLPRAAEFINCDIADKNKISDVLKKKKFDITIHLAALIKVEESVANPEKYNHYNYEKTLDFFNLCLENGLNKIIFSSTASVYGNPDKMCVSETDKLNPLNPYALSKLKVEEFLINKSKEIPFNYTILRYFNVAGADKKLRRGLISNYSTHLIKVACEVAIGKKEKLIINGNDYDTKDGTPVRDYIHVSDLAEIHLLVTRDLLKSAVSNIFNCGYGKGYSVNEVVNTFNKILKKDLPIAIGPRRPSDSKYIVSNSDKFKNYFSWNPKFNNLACIIKSSLDWENKINNKY